MVMTSFSFARFMAMLRKEWLQMRHDPMTIGLVVMLPLMQLFLFGFAINTNPHDLPTGVLSADHSTYERTLTVALQNTGYFRIRSFTSEQQADEALADGEVLFVLEIPPNFARSVDRGEHPSVLLDADATDPVAIGNATAAVAALNANVLARDLPPNMQTTPTQPPFNVVVHARYNPEQITALNIVPGLIGTILMMSTLVITTLSITREREAGTMENLLAMPIRPIEVMLGKIVPYIGLGYVQVLLIIGVSSLAFQVPMRGSLLVLLGALGVFIGGNLALGITFSTLARTQQQAQQLAQFSLLPQMMLSGFMFPFQGMPAWARGIGELLPLTHILRVCRGVMLKGNGLAEIVPNLWPMALFALVMGVVAVLCYRETLD
jgi:ABC-2 type transport system permease protein